MVLSRYELRELPLFFCSASDVNFCVVQLEVEAYDFVNDDYVYIGKGTAVLSYLLPVNSINIALFFHLELVAYEPRFEGPRPCEIHVRGLVSDKDPIEGS